MTTTTNRRRVVTAATSMLLLAAAACGTEETATAPPSTPSTTQVARPTNSFDELMTISEGRLHLRCSGEGDTTVVLIAGWDHSSADWATVEPAMADATRVCAYDRFGTGTSDAPATPQTFEMQVADLHELLEVAGEPGPYVVVGHSFGGAEAITFASTYGDEVVGLALVDASPSDWPDVVCSVSAYAGGCELMHTPTQGERLDVFPAFEALARIGSLGDLPMTVLTDLHRDDQRLPAAELARLDARWAEGSQRWADLSTTSNLITVEDTTHDIHVDHPDLVVDEITKLLGGRSAVG